MRCGNCVGWNAATQECRVKGPEWLEDFADPVWPKTKADDWCGWFCDNWKDLQDYNNDKRLRE